MWEILPTKGYKKDVRKIYRRGYNLDKLEAITERLKEEGNAAPKNSPHKLSGDWDGYWECHIASDWLLIYDIDEEEQVIRLYRTGTHSDLF